MPSLSAPARLSRRSTWGRLTLRTVLLLGVCGMAVKLAPAGLIGYLEQTHEHRFEPWVGDDPSYSEDPLSVLGPPLSPLALFPWMWQRHHPGDVVSRHTLELLEAGVVRPGPPVETASRGTKTSRLAGPWGTRRKMQESYRELFDEPRETAKGGEGGPEQVGQPTTGTGRRRSKSVDDDDADGH